MPRTNNWPLKLALHIEEKRNQPFAWGENDCCMAACDWAIVGAGVDPAAEIRGSYRSALGAARVLRAAGGLEALVERRFSELGWLEISVGVAQRGDLAIYDLNPDGSLMPSALTIVVGGKVIVPGETGLQFFPLASCRRAWRVS